MERRLTAKSHKPISRKQWKAKKKLRAITLQRARGKALVIEGEELLDDPELEDELDGSDIIDDFNLDL